MLKNGALIKGTRFTQVFCCSVRQKTCRPAGGRRRCSTKKGDKRGPFLKSTRLFNLPAVRQAELGGKRTSKDI